MCGRKKRALDFLKKKEQKRFQERIFCRIKRQTAVGINARTRSKSLGMGNSVIKKRFRAGYESNLTLFLLAFLILWGKEAKCMSRTIPDE